MVFHTDQSVENSTSTCHQSSAWYLTWHLTWHVSPYHVVVHVNMWDLCWPDHLHFPPMTSPTREFPTFSYQFYGTTCFSCSESTNEFVKNVFLNTYEFWAPSLKRHVISPVHIQHRPQWKPSKETSGGGRSQWQGRASQSIKERKRPRPKCSKWPIIQ